MNYLNCDIKPKDYDKFEYLANTFALSPYELKHLKYNLNNKETKTNIDKINKSKIFLKNRYLSNNEYGYKITFID